MEFLNRGSVHCSVSQRVGHSAFFKWATELEQNVVRRQLFRPGSAIFFALRAGSSLALFCEQAGHKIMDVWLMQIYYNS